MIKNIKVDTLNEKSINKAFLALHKVNYNFNFKTASKLKLSDLNVIGHKIFSKHNINTIGDASKLTLNELQNLKGIGPKANLSLQDAVIINGVEFKYPAKKKTIKAKAAK